MKGSRPLTESEVEKILAFLASSSYPARNRALFILGVKTGFRISELLSLKVRDVVQNGNLVDRIAVERKNMKRKREGRTVVLHAEAIQAIAELLSELQLRSHAQPAGPLFRSRLRSPRAMSRVTAWEMLKGAYAACGLTGKLGTHCMRKTFAKKIYAKLGKDLIRTQKALGHASVNSTVSYLSFSDEEIDDAILKS